MLGLVLRRAIEAGRDWGDRASTWLLARRPALDALLDSRPRWFLPAVAVAGLLIGIGLVAWIASAARHAADGEPAAKEPTSASAALATSMAERPSETHGPASLTACSVIGAPRIVAPKAILSAGIEARAAEDSIVIGFAPTEHEGVAERLNSEDLSVLATTTARSGSTVRRVTPTLAGSSLGAIVDSDPRGDSVRGRRTVTTEPPVQLGESAGGLVWARPGGEPAGKLWDLKGDGEVDAEHVAIDNEAAEPTWAVTFRRGRSVFVGWVSPTQPPTARDLLTRFDSPGLSIGAPAVTVHDGVLIAAWADRSSPDEPWRIRLVRLTAGSAPPEPTSFTPPSGGRGEQTMSPALVAAPGGRFLFAWTEGAQARHDVRALTLDDGAHPVGSPLAVSSAGSNAGQAQVALTASGRGAIVFLESTDSSFRVMATPVSCAP
jgi:hypothetical protein